MAYILCEALGLCEVLGCALGESLLACELIEIGSQKL